MRGLGRQWARHRSGPLGASISFDIFCWFKAGLLRPAFFVFGVALLLMAGAISGPAQAACTESICYEYDVLGRLIKTIMPGAGPGGTDQGITYSYDAAGNRTTRTIGNGNLPPDAVNDTMFGIEAYSFVDISVLANDSDPDQDPLTITSVTSPTIGTVDIIWDGGGIQLYTAQGDGDLTFTYTISDGNGGTATATVTVSVEAAECPTWPFCGF